MTVDDSAPDPGFDPTGPSGLCEEDPRVARVDKLKFWLNAGGASRSLVELPIAWPANVVTLMA